MGPKAKIWVFLLLVCLAQAGFSQQFIKTDAAGGIFGKDQLLSFELNAPGWFRILLNENEIYRGGGPAYQELGVPPGEERGFVLRAEYFNNRGELAENLSWYIYIDKKAPPFPAMEFRSTGEGLRLIQYGAEANTKIRALAETDGNPVFFPNLADHRDLPIDFYPSEPFSALVWIEDQAGNYSGFRNVYFDLSFVKIENPAPGEWLNLQTLIIAGAEGKSIYWTSDGTHPLEAGGSGRLYRGPVRIARDGKVLLRIAWREADGRVMEDRVSYSVTPNSSLTNGPDGRLDSLSKAEEWELRSQLSFDVPSAWLWSVGSAPREQLEGKITLRPEPLVKRTVALHLSPSKASGVYRFVYILDGSDSSAVWGEHLIPVSPLPVAETYLYSTENHGSFPPLKLVSAGRNRVIVWPETEGRVYYSWGGIWTEVNGPVPVPIHGGNLRWFVLDSGIKENEALPGPYSASVAAAQPGKREALRGRIACRKYSESYEWEYVSPFMEFTPGLIKFPGKDVCDGEDLVWAFLSSGGKVLEQQRRDRLSPPVPGIEGLPENGWTRGPVKLGVSGCDNEHTCVMDATLSYTSGKTEKKSGKQELELISVSGERAEVTVEALLIDSLGNRGPKAIRHFTLDPGTIYVSPEPIVNKPGLSAAAGDFYKPFTSIEEAIGYANTRGTGDIRIAGKLELTKPVTVSRNMRIEGGWSWDGGKTEASVILGSDFGWNLQQGASLTLSGLRLERPNGNAPLIRTGKNAKVEITGADISGQGPLLTLDSGVCVINDSRLNLKIPGDRRIAAISVRSGSVEIKNSRIQLEGIYGLVLDHKGGSLSAAESNFSASGGKTASLIVLNNARGSFSTLTLNAAATDYASALEAHDSELVVSGGSFEVSARDASAVLLESCTAVVLGTQIRVGGVFAARAFEINGPFPLVQNCGFYSTGKSERTEVFSGQDIPRAGNISGNNFSGFSHIWGPGWPVEKLSAFNQIYALPDKPNTAALRP